MGDMQTPNPQNPQNPQNPIEANRSIMNPMDAAAMAQKGTINPNMTVKDFIEGVLHISVEAPLTQFVQALQKQQQNATGIGKMHNIAQSAPQGAPQQMPQMPQRPPQAQQAPQAPQGAPTGLAGLANRL